MYLHTNHNSLVFYVAFVKYTYSHNSLVFYVHLSNILIHIIV